MLIRIVVTVIATGMTYFFAFWISTGLLAAVLPWRRPGAAGFALGVAVAVFSAGAVARYVWRATGAAASLSPGLAGAVLRGALILGTVGFTAGFIGPIVFAPGANQGPLLGIFITGPLGLVVGAIAGAVRWRITQRARDPQP